MSAIKSSILAWPGAPLIAVPLIVLGLALALYGLHGVFVRFPRTNDIMIYLRTFRIGVVGLAIAGVGAAWLWQTPWLLAVAVGVGLQELRESSSYISTIRRRRRSQPPASSTTS